MTPSSNNSLSAISRYQSDKCMRMQFHSVYHLGDINKGTAALNSGNITYGKIQTEIMYPKAILYSIAF